MTPERAATAGVDPGTLPPLVGRYAEWALAGAPAGKIVTIRQSGEMTLRPGARPLRFRAAEEFSADRVGFAWQARLPPVGPLALRATDRYQAGQGLLEVRLLGFPLQRRRGPELALGEAFRYLAEIAWVPQAILANPDLSWRTLDGAAVEVETTVGSERAAVQLQFNEHGEIARTEALRPRAEAANALTQWIGEFHDYKDLGGVRVPTRGTVRWELPEGPFTYWNGTITSLEVR